MNKLDYSWDPVWTKRSYARESLRVTKAKKKADWLLDQHRVREADIVLDVGCGGGYVSRELYNRVGCKITGIDISENAIKTAQKLSAGVDDIKFMLGSATNLNKIKTKSVDVALYIGCLEHVEEFDDAISEAYRTIKPGGYIYIVSSNYFSFVHWLAYKGRQKLGLWRYGYEKDWKPSNLEDRLHQAGFKKAFCQIQFSVGNTKFLNCLDRIARISDKRFGRYVVYGGNKPRN